MFAPARRDYQYYQDEEFGEELIRQDLCSAKDAEVAYQMQLELALAISNSNNSNGADLMDFSDDTESDYSIALRMNADAFGADLSARLLDEMEERDTLNLKDRRLAQTVREQELRRKEDDARFARELQQKDNSGFDIDHPQNRSDGRPIPLALPGPILLDIPGIRAIANLPVNHGKGKGKARAASVEIIEKPPQNLGECSICLSDSITIVTDPFRSSSAANTSNAVIYGIDLHAGTRDPRLTGKNRHIGCVSCLTTYIMKKLKESQIPFPINCPCCSVEIGEAVALKIIGKKNMDEWHYQRLLMDTPHIFCPNKRCSGRVVLNQDGNPQAECPECNKLICGSCKTMWHNGFSCAAYQALPAEQKDLEDREALQLAQTKGWKRCSNCKHLVELDHGCNHISCLCGAEWCYVCGKKWTKEQCETGCALFDEANLVNARAAQAAAAQVARARVVAPVPNRVGGQNDLQRAQQVRLQQQQALQQQVAEANRADALRAQIERGLREREMMEEEEEEDEAAYYQHQRLNQYQARELALQGLSELGSYAGGAHAFTNAFARELVCLYCPNHPRFDRFESLVAHLAEADHHVYACCGKLFRVQEHLNQHVDYPSRDGAHRPFSK